VRAAEQPTFWWATTGCALLFGWFLLFLLDVDRSGFQSAMTVITGTASAVLAGTAWRVWSRSRRDR
jgi:hypothetical protein